jgi:Helix-turn-helix domain
VWERSRSRGPARLVLLAIADNAHDDGAQAWPSMMTLVRKTGLAERTVQGALNTLQELGELEVAHNAGPRHCNLYRVLMTTPAPDAPPQEMHPAGDAGVQEMHPTPAGDAPPPPQEMHPEPSIEPSRNRQGKTFGGSAAEQTKPPDAQVVTFRPDVERLCNLLADGVQANTGERPKITKRGWLDPARLLLDRDGYTAEQVEALIRWSQDSEFWRSHILSMSKLRDKRLTLIAQARRDAPRHRPGEPASWAAFEEL